MITARLCWVLVGVVGLASTATRAADIGRGAQLYRMHCSTCHGASGRPVLPTAPDFSQPTALLRPDPTLLASIRQGRGGMPAYAGVLRDREILDIVAHMRTFRR
jgi:cytochrome c6